jgi:hypothetical protein
MLETTGQRLTKTVCSKCKKSKHRSEFHPSSTSKKGLQSACKECKTAADVLLHEQARDRRITYIEEHAPHCPLCKTSYIAEVYEFHHPYPDKKESGLKASLWRGKSRYLKTLEEAAKCIILCANCHRAEHAALRKGFSLLTIKDQNENTD